ncbi:DUF7311 family protein [Haloarchaeobius amylolyticus]|uniref:DUF7311 family protein n=1 Tax=Haloarchaeobius amylolyticus TaxID=1198296 RepID=UPI00227215F9|nr:ABC transporter [Haloarchaeobius amylolyticus]
MSVRTVVAVVLALALLAATLPALDAARETRSDQQVAADLHRLEVAGEGLLATEDATPGPGARRVVTVRLPADGWTTREVAWVSVGGVPGEPDAQVLAYRLAGGPVREVRVGVAFRTPGGRPLVLEGSGEHRLVLTLQPDGEGVCVGRSRDS